MTWGWDGRGSKSVELGGNRGSVGEAYRSTTWPAYEAGYLKNRLMNANNDPRAEIERPGEFSQNSAFDKYNVSGLDPDVQTAYLDRVTANYKEEADEALKDEFTQWLQGNHSTLNNEKLTYQPADNQRKRKFLFSKNTGRGGGSGIEGVEDAGAPMVGWHPTWWGKESLAHLDGVGDYLRGMKTRDNDHDFQMQLLAEFGPQNIDQAWAYFKHWVKGRPLSENEFSAASATNGGKRAPGANQEGDNFHKNDFGTPQEKADGEQDALEERVLRTGDADELTDIVDNIRLRGNPTDEMFRHMGMLQSRLKHLERQARESNDLGLHSELHQLRNRRREMQNAIRQRLALEPSDDTRNMASTFDEGEREFTDFYDGDDPSDEERAMQRFVYDAVVNAIQDLPQSSNATLSKPNKTGGDLFTVDKNNFGTIAEKAVDAFLKAGGNPNQKIGMYVAAALTRAIMTYGDPDDVSKKVTKGEVVDLAAAHETITRVKSLNKGTYDPTAGQFVPTWPSVRPTEPDRIEIQNAVEEARDQVSLETTLDEIEMYRGAKLNELQEEISANQEMAERHRQTPSDFGADEARHKKITQQFKDKLSDLLQAQMDIVEETQAAIAKGDDDKLDAWLDENEKARGAKGRGTKRPLTPGLRSPWMEYMRGKAALIYDDEWTVMDMLNRIKRKTM